MTVPSVGEGVEDTWICGGGGEVGGLVLIDGGWFGDTDDRGCNVIDFGNDCLSGRGSVFVDDSEEDVIVAIVSECMIDILTANGGSCVSKVPTISQSIEDARICCCCFK